jgi:hypothetical protein
MQSYLAIMAQEYEWLHDLKPANIDQFTAIRLEVIKKFDPR